MPSAGEISLSFIFTTNPTCVVCGKRILNLVDEDNEYELKETLTTNNLLEDVDHFINNKLYIICSPIEDTPCLALFEGCYLSYEDKGVYIDDPEKRKVLEEAFAECQPSQICV